MITGTSHIELSLKRLLGLADFGERFYQYLDDGANYFGKRVFTSSGFFGVCTLSAGGADRFDLLPNTDAADGDGHFLRTLAGLCAGIQFENSLGIPYYVGLRWAEVPDGIVVNPRTGYPEFGCRENVIGDSAAPDSVAVSGSGLRMVVTSVTESGVSLAGRQCKVWKVTPAKGATTPVLAIETVAVQWIGGVNVIDTVAQFGQGVTPSTTASDYMVCLLGPTVRKNTDLRTTGDNAFVGIVTGAGTGNPPAVFDITDQVEIISTLSGLNDIVRTGPGGHLKIRVKSYAGDGTTPQIEVDNELGVLKFSVDKDGNVNIKGNLDVTGTTTEHNIETIYSDETITGNLTAGDGAGDSHTIRGTWNHLYATSSLAFQVDGTTGHVGLFGPAHATDPISAGGHVVPKDDISYDLGDPSRRWRSLYALNIYFSGDFLPLSDISQDLGSDSYRWEEAHYRHWKNFLGHMYMSHTGEVGVGTFSTPQALLHIGNQSGLGTPLGLLVGYIAGPSIGSNMIETIGNRNDMNPGFGGRIGISHWRSDGSPIQDNSTIGAVWFGGQHTGGVTFSRSNHLYSAAIQCRTFGAWTDSGNLGSYLTFRVGKSATAGQGQDLYAAAYPGTEVCHITETGLLSGTHVGFDLGRSDLYWRNLFFAGYAFAGDIYPFASLSEVLGDGTYKWLSAWISTMYGNTVSLTCGVGNNFSMGFNGTNPVIEFDTNLGGDYFLYNRTSEQLQFFTFGLEQFRIDYTTGIWGKNHSPLANITYNLGYSTYRWLNAWIDNVQIGGWTIKEVAGALRFDYAGAVRNYMGSTASTGGPGMHLQQTISAVTGGAEHYMLGLYATISATGSCSLAQGIRNEFVFSGVGTLTASIFAGDLLRVAVGASTTLSGPLYGHWTRFDHSGAASSYASYSSETPIGGGSISGDYICFDAKHYGGLSITGRTFGFKAASTLLNAFEGTLQIGTLAASPAQRFYVTAGADSATPVVAFRRTAVEADGSIYFIETSTYNDVEFHGHDTYFGTFDASDLYLYTNNTRRLQISSGGQISTGNASASVDCAADGGMTIWPDSSTATNHCTVKLTSLNTGFLTPHTDTFCRVLPFSTAANNGGLRLEGYSGTAQPTALMLAGYSNDPTPSTVTTNAAYGTVTVYGYSPSGVAADNLFVVRDSGAGARLILKYNGALHVDAAGAFGNYLSATFDDEKDAVACQDLSYVVANECKNVLEYNKEKFEDLGILQGGFLCVQKTNMLMLGAIGELHQVVAHLANQLGLEYDEVRKMVRVRQAALAARRS